MRNSMRSMGLTILGLAVGWVGSRAAVIVADHDNPGGLPAVITAEAAAVPAAPSANYAFVALPPVGHPLQITEDGTAILITYNSGNVYAYRWRQGVLTELSCIRPAGTRIKLHAANRNGMVVVVFELPTRAYFAVEGGLTKQVVVAWMPESTTPVFLNVPIAAATTWGLESTMRSVDFKFLDDQNRIWGDTYHVVQGPDGTLIYPELARWDTPGAAATFIGHKQHSLPSVNLLGVSSGSGEPFGRYTPPEPGSGTYPFAGNFNNRLNYVPAQMNRQGWVLGKRGFTPVLSRDGVEYPLPSNNTIALIDDRNNVYDINRSTVWTTNPATFESTPTGTQNSYVAIPMRSIALPEGYSSNLPVLPGGTTLELGNLFTASTAIPAIFVPAEIRPDANRDGIITVGRMPDDPDRLLAEKKLPWYFWVNDDNDAGETDGNDIPGDGSNGNDTSVNGVRDLVDFFPLHLNIARLLAILPSTTPGISYNLVQAQGAANFLTTDLSPETAGKYNSDADIAKGLIGNPVTRITPEGTPLDAALIAQASIQNKGVILVEARAPTIKPLQLEVRRGTELLARLDLPLSFAGVEDMFRHRNLVKAVNQKADTLDRNSATNWPDSLNNNQAFVFVHGYNVNQKQARGWQAEFFKRLWWSGSKAQFWGVTWYGYDSQVPGAHFTPNYHINVIHAFGAASKLADFIREVRQPGTNINKVNVAAHSLGNMLVSSTISDKTQSNETLVDRYFMLDAAVAAEAYDGAVDSQVVQPEANTANMPLTDWNKTRGDIYPSKLWATNWHKLFQSPDDKRASLTWRNRFAPTGNTNYYDFHSTGEEVLDYDDAVTPDLPFVLLEVAANKLSDYLHFRLPFSTGQPAGHKTWQYQEQLKGRTASSKVLGSNYGGWGFNFLYFKKFPVGGGKGPLLAPAAPTPDDAKKLLETVLTNDFLREEPFFRPGGWWTTVGTWEHIQGKPNFHTERLRLLYGTTTGSTFASTHRDTLLARMIPAMSPAAGRIALPKLTTDAGEERNFDMSSPTIRGIVEQWPSPPLRNDKKWRHSDFREIAYPYVNGLYKRISTLGNLDSAAP